MCVHVCTRREPDLHRSSFARPRSHMPSHYARVRLPREPCGERQLLHVDDERQPPRPTGMQHSAAHGRTYGSEQESHPRRRSPARHVRTANRGGGGALKCGFKQVFVADAGIRTHKHTEAKGTGSKHSRGSDHHSTTKQDDRDLGGPHATHLYRAPGAPCASTPWDQSSPCEPNFQ